MSQTKAFIRLYDVGNQTDCGEDESGDDGNTRAFKQHLCEGRIRSPIYYLNTLGSLQIMQKIKEKADSEQITGEDSPQGHWAKNFGGISVHRRGNWAVTMKGISSYAWDTASSSSENMFGLYQSQGALEIANSECTLGHHDIDNGWDWAKVPGTTAIGFDTLDLKTNDDKRYNPNKHIGGATFSGRHPYDLSTLHGVFGMLFKQPSYKLPSNSPLRSSRLQFRKSVFFHDDFLVCVGSRITTRSVTGGKKTYTTIFQDKVLEPSAMDPQVHKCGVGSTQTPDSWGTAPSVLLEDAKGNG